MSLVVALLASVSFVGACGDGDVDAPPSEQLTAQARTPAASPAASTAVSPAAVSPGPSPDAPTPQQTLDAQTVAELNNLARLSLVQGDLPSGFEVARSQRALKEQIVEAQVAIPEIALFLRDSSLQGAWAALYADAGAPQAGVSSIVYLFDDPADAAGFVEAYRQVRAEDYLTAIEVQALQAPPVGEQAYYVRFRRIDGRSLELTWSQGPLVGQVILRYTEDTEDPGDPDLVVGLAAVQAQRMASFLP
jgi:hypothetical protein